MSHPLARLRVASLSFLAFLLGGQAVLLAAEFRSVSECQARGDTGSGPGLVARIHCYNDVMGAIGFHRAKAQDLSGMVRAIQGTLASDSAKSCLDKPYDVIVASSVGGFCSGEWNSYRDRLVELESYGCRNEWMPLSDEAKAIMPNVDEARTRYETCFEDALMNGKIAADQIQHYQIRSRDHFKELYAKVAKDWQINGAAYTALFYEHLTACKADGNLLRTNFTTSVSGTIVCGSE